MLDDTTASVQSNPVGGGPGSITTQHVLYHSKSDLTGSQYFSGALGLSFNPDSDMGMTAEIQIGVQKSITLAGNLGF